MAYNPYNFGYPQGFGYPQPTPQTPMMQSAATYYGNSQIVQVAGKASVDMIRLEPYKGLLALDTTAPILWVCTADGVGHVTATPFDIAPHKEAPQSAENGAEIERRITTIEDTIKGLEDKINGTYQSGTPGREPKHSSTAQIIDANGAVVQGSDVLPAGDVRPQSAITATNAVP